MKKTLIALVALGLFGCSTSPISPDKAKKVPESRIKWHNQGDAAVVITRDVGLLTGGGCFMAATIDGQVAARIDTG